MSQKFLGDFSRQNYPPACLFARLPRCDSSHIALLCSFCHALKTNENPTQSGNFVSANRLSNGTTLANGLRLLLFLRNPDHGASGDTALNVVVEHGR